MSDAPDDQPPWDDDDAAIHSASGIDFRSVAEWQHLDDPMLLWCEQCGTVHELHCA